MSYGDTLTAEIDSVIETLRLAGNRLEARWIANEICSRHMAGLTDGEDADFWRFCGYMECREQVRRRISRIEGKDALERVAQQHLLPGFEHLQSYYVVKRDGEDIGVPVGDMTDDELAAKATTYRAMGKACFAHAREIDRFLEMRAAAVAL